MSDLEVRTRRAKRYRQKVRRRQEAKEQRVILAVAAVVAMAAGYGAGKVRRG